MSSVTQVAEAMQTILSDVADQAAYRTGFVQRESKMGGAEFVQTVTFGWLSNPQATLNELTQTAATLGVVITPQGLEARFTPAAAACLQAVLQQAVAQVMAAHPVAVPLLQRFTAIYLTDSTQIQLPGALAEVWQGNGGYHVPKNGSAALKVQLRWEWLTGQLEGPFLQNGRAADRSSPTQVATMPAGALKLADLGYFSLDTLQAISAQQAYWLTRVMAGTQVYEAAGAPLELCAWLEHQTGLTVECPIQLGKIHRLPARLLAVRMPAAVVARRRRQLKEAARRRQQPVSPERWALAHWTLLVTNVPPEKLSLPEALIVARVRWQIELLFKLWKSQGHVDTSPSGKPWRILCEVYAKLLAMVIQHWVTLTAAWAAPDRSLVKAAQTIRKHALHLASRLVEGEASFIAGLQVIQRCLQTGCRIEKRRNQPSAFQLWFDPDSGLLA